ncbi:MAG: hypothetical protein Q7K42_05510 [Candidatus Diapherotrites archaeon]|nr:hypothetical protein [Candidatus Diapherotrites archaeon]
MILRKPCFPVSISYKDVVDLAADEVKELGWEENDFAIKTAILIYTPYWVFSYSVYHEEESSKRKTKVVSEEESGSNAINASTRELDPEVAELEEENPPEKVGETLPNSVVERSGLDADEAKDLVAIKIAKELELPKNNVLISNLHMVYFPMWKVEVTVEDKSVPLEFDAVTGDLLGEPEIPEKGSSWEDAAKQTVTELKEPNNWLKYFAEGIIWIISHPLLKNLGHKLWTNRRLQAVILLIILALIVLDSYGLIRIFR